MPNAGGRVLDATGSPIPGVYCAGWIKRGPTGVIGTNKKDATETVDLLLEDARAGVLTTADANGSIDALLAERGIEVVTHGGWEAIDAVERARGQRAGTTAREAVHVGGATRGGAAPAFRALT